jgi:hypothetical protein
MASSNGTKPHRTTKRAPKPSAGRGGRPSLYQPIYAEQAAKLCALGATDADLADFFGVVVNTIDNWKHAHPEFLGSLKNAKATADGEVERSLFRRAMGYEHDAVKIMAVADGQGIGSHIEQVPYVERYPPDTTAAIFWLKNRQPDRWRDKHEVEHDVSGNLAQLMREAEERVNGR